jgi:hypothetical protein
VDIVAAFPKMSTKPDQAHPLVHEARTEQLKPNASAFGLAFSASGDLLKQRVGLTIEHAAARPIASAKWLFPRAGWAKEEDAFALRGIKLSVARSLTMARFIFLLKSPGVQPRELDGRRLAAPRARVSLEGS